MSRKHNTKHDRSPSNYKKRLAKRGLGRTPVMSYTGMSADQITRHFATLPHYRWTLEKDEYVDQRGRVRTEYRQVRHLIPA